MIRAARTVALAVVFGVATASAAPEEAAAPSVWKVGQTFAVTVEANETIAVSHDDGTPLVIAKIDERRAFAIVVDRIDDAGQPVCSLTFTRMAINVVSDGVVTETDYDSGDAKKATLPRTEGVLERVRLFQALAGRKVTVTLSPQGTCASVTNVGSVADAVVRGLPDGVGIGGWDLMRLNGRLATELRRGWARDCVVLPATRAKGATSVATSVFDVLYGNAVVTDAFEVAEATDGAITLARTARADRFDGNPGMKGTVRSVTRESTIRIEGNHPLRFDAPKDRVTIELAFGAAGGPSVKIERTAKVRSRLVE